MGSRISSKKPDDIWIAVVGAPGAGKTSLINGLRDVGDGGVSPAPNTGPAVSYGHPKHPNVTIWEFPSNSGSNIGLDQYDLLIIASALDRFSADYAKLTKDALAKGKACYFIRTKVDTDVKMYGSIISSIYQLDSVLEGITSTCTHWLAEEGLQSPTIFLVSNTNTEIYHFPSFYNTIEEKIGELKRTKGLIEDSSGQPTSTDHTEGSGLDLAILGDQWSGKSSLINALRDVQDGDEAAALTGTGDPATEPIVYPFPKCPNIRLWELPGISANLQPEQYLKQVNGKKYGIFIIVASEIFKEHHSQFSKALQKMGKKVYFARTKTDGYLEASKQRLKSRYNENKTVKELRQMCEECLRKGGVQDPEVYILTSFETEKFDFRSLRSRIENHPEAIRYEIFKRIGKEEREEMNRAFDSGGLPEVASKMLARLKSTDDITINIGVIGETGAGKSSLVNAIRDVLDDQGGAAPTGVTETTMAPTVYPHPTFHNVQIWDLPGLGTRNFQLDNYLEQVGFGRYDFFIIVASERFKENHAKLAKWINERGAKFYFVRTKIDNDIEASKKRRPAEFNQHQVLQLMRDDSLKYLEQAGVKTPRVFLVSAFNFKEYDSELLQETLESELPKYRKQAFQRSIATSSSEIIERKKNSLSREIWKMALVSSMAAATPIPGLGIVCDVTILKKYLPSYCEIFGLDEESLKRIALEIEKPVEDLKAQIHSPLTTEINTALIHKLLSNSAGSGIMLGEYLLSGLPVVGSIASGSIGFATTCRMFSSFLGELAADAERVLTWVIDSQIE